MKDVTPGSDTENISQDEYQHQEKLKEVEELLIRENGGWKCKTCKKTHKRKDMLRRHAEIHVSLSLPCNYCSEILTTRNSY